MAVTISLTGRLAIDIDGVQADEARLGRLGRLAFAVLARERHRPVPQAELAAALWGDERPDGWASVLEDVAARVRTVLAEAGLDDPDTVRSRYGCFQLRLGRDVVVDVEKAAAAADRAERAVRTARNHPYEALAAAREAAHTARRPFLDGAAGPWAQRQQAQLRNVLVRALEVVAETASTPDINRHEEAVAAAEEAVGLARHREPAHLRLIWAQARAGNRPAALRAYERCRVLLAEVNRAPSPETEAAYRQLLGDALVVESAVRTNVAVDATSFVGREDAVEAVAAHLAANRVVTLAGPAGVGKSRLARHTAAAAAAAGHHPDGVWLVDLAGLRNPGLVTGRILSTIGAPEMPGTTLTESLLRQLAGRRALLVLDNCEHVAAACVTAVEAICEACPAVRILATSRVPLASLYATTWTVPGLAPDDARRLFGDRAQRRAGAAESNGDGPALDDHAVAAVCDLLDGIPLAIELAAAAPPSDLALLRERLGKHAAVPGPLAVTLVWSRERLPAAVRPLFDALSVFAGGFTPAAAAAVCAAPGLEIGDALAALEAAALIRTDPGSGRHSLHEVVRQYGAMWLESQGDDTHLRTRHLFWAVDLAEEAGPGLEGAEQTRWLATLDAELDNIRAALDWAAETGQAEAGLRTTASLVRYWEIRGFLREGRDRLDQWSADLVDPPLRAKALHAAAVLAQRQHDLDSAREAYEESLLIRRKLDDRVGTSVALHGLANLAVADDDFATARALYEENLAIGRELGHRRMVAASLMNLGVLAHYCVMRSRDSPEQAGADARAFYEASLAEYRDLGDRHGEALALENLGGLGPFVGDLEASLARHEESMAIRRELGDKMGIAASARFLATRATWNGEFATARQLHEERLVIERELGNKANVADALVSLAEIAGREGNLAEARRLLGESIELSEALGDRPAIRHALALTADVARRQGEVARARAALDGADALARDLGDGRNLAWHTVPRARLARHDRDLRTALRLSHEALDHARRDWDADAANAGHLEAAALELLAAIAVDEREFPRAARLLGAAATARPAVPAPHLAGRPPDPDVARDASTTRTSLGEPLFEALFNQGRTLSAAARRAYARGGVDE